MTRFSRQERGNVSIEGVAICLGLLLVTLFAFQFFAIMYAGQSAGRAAWDGARAQSLGESGLSAVHASMPTSVQIESVSNAGGGLSVTVRPQRILPFYEVGTITRTAHVP